MTQLLQLTDCLFPILSYLDPVDLSSVAKSCTTLRVYATDDILWKPVIEKLGLIPIAKKAYKQYMVFSKIYCDYFATHTNKEKESTVYQLFLTYVDPDCYKNFENLRHNVSNIFHQKFKIDKALTILKLTDNGAQEQLDRFLRLCLENEYDENAAFCLIEGGATVSTFTMFSLIFSDKYISRLNLLKLLIEKGVKVNNKMISCACGKLSNYPLEFIYFLIDHLSEVPDKHLLNSVLSKGASLEWIKLIIEKGAKPDETAIYFALRDKVKLEIVHYLLDYGIIPDSFSFYLCSDLNFLQTLIDKIKVQKIELEQRILLEDSPIRLHSLKQALYEENKKIVEILNQAVDRSLEDEYYIHTYYHHLMKINLLIKNGAILTQEQKEKVKALVERFKPFFGDERIQINYLLSSLKMV